MATLGEIEELAKAFAAARSELSDKVGAVERLVERIKRRRIAGIKSAVARAAEAQDRLHAAIDSAPELFQKPKSLVLHGVRVGYQKQRGQLTIEDETQTVRLIRKYFPAEFDRLVKVSEKPLKPALNQLSAAELRRLGVTVEADTEAVLIKPTDSEVDKLVDALLKESQADDEKVPA